MTNEFENTLKDPSSSVVIDSPYRDRASLIAFGGITGSLVIPPYEFFNLTRNIEVNKIFLRDLNQAWYHLGLPGISDNIEDTARFLIRKVKESGTNKVVVIGNSMGGYAAILFGVLIKADIVHAFSPHTFINDINYIRSKKQIQHVHNNFTSKYFDLRDIIQLHGQTIELNIYYDPNDKLDQKHVMHLEGLQNITLHSFRRGGHNLIKTLRDSGELQRIIVSSVYSTPDNTINVDTKKRRSFLARLFGFGYG